MTRAHVWLAAVLLLPAPAATAAPGEDGGGLLITGAKILDPAGERLVEGRRILLTGGRIARIAPGAEDDAGKATRLDLDGLTVVPGLIDLHTHLLLHPYDEATWNDQVLRESLELRTIRAVDAARRTLEAGFTTLRDLGTEGAGYADVALRDAIAQGIVPGPRILASTRAIVTTGGYGPAGFDPRWNVPKGAQVADGADEVRRAVREQIAAGADWIKVYVDYHRRPGAPATPTFTAVELGAIVDEAGSAGIPVAAHATTDEGIRRAVRAGVRTIEHGTGASAGALAIMRERGVVLCPTLAAAEAMARFDGWKPGDEEHPRIAEAKALMTRALAARVIIAGGSDAGVFTHGDNARELELLVEYGMAPGEALRAATVIGARVLGRGDELGRIAEGAVADLIAVRGDPLHDVSSLREPVVVIKGGVVVMDRR